MAGKKIKVTAMCNMFENETNIAKGQVFETTEERGKALGDSVKPATAVKETGKRGGKQGTVPAENRAETGSPETH